MLKALEYRYDACENKLTSSTRQPAVCPLADVEFDVASSSTSFADSGRGLSCEVHDETAVKSLTAAGGREATEPPGSSSEVPGRRPEPTEPPGQSYEVPGRRSDRPATEPLGRNMETFGRGMEPIGRRVEPPGHGLETTSRRGNTVLVVTVEDSLMAQSAALDACRQMQLPQIRSTVNVVGGGTGMNQS